MKHIPHQQISPAPEIHERLILDATKVQWHQDRLLAWAHGEKFAPITVDMALTRACQASCVFCLHEDERVHMADGSMKRIRDVKAGDLVRSIAPNGQFAESIVTQAWQTSSQMATIVLRTDTGTVRLTSDHPLLTPMGWMAAGDLKIGDRIGWQGGTFWEETGVAFPRGAAEAIRAYARLQSGTHGYTRDKRETIISFEAALGGRTSGFSMETTKQGTSPKVECRPQRERTQAYSGQKTSLGGPHSYNTIQASCRSLESHKTKAHNTSIRYTQQNSHLPAHEAKQSHVESHHQGEGYSNHPRSMGTASQRSPRYVLDKGQLWAEQGGGETIDRAGAIGLPVRGGWPLLDWPSPKWEATESRFHSNRATASCSISRNLLAFPGGCGRSARIGRLSSIRLDSANNNGTSTSQVVGWARVIGIENADPGPVWDLEVVPYHNFIAGEGAVVRNCYALMQENERQVITIPVMERFLTDCAHMGVRAISLVSDGESTLSPAYAYTIQRGHELGIDMASGTNGLLVTREVAEAILPALTYIRVNINSATAEGNRRIMGYLPGWHEKVIQNIRDMVAIKWRDNLAVTIGMQMVLMPQYGEEILPLARLAVDLGVDYLVIKHCSDDEDGSLGVRYQDYARWFDTMREAEALSTDRTQISAKWNKIMVGNNRSYQRCYGPPFIIQVSGSGLVAPCGMLFNEKFSKLHIGNIVQDSFYDLVLGDKSDWYWKVMGYLGSDRFNAQQVCGALCLQDLTNRALDDHRTGKRHLLLQPIGTKPAHGNFI